MSKKNQPTTHRLLTARLPRNAIPVQHIASTAARPGRTHDITAARHDNVPTRRRAAGLGALADLGFRGLDNYVRPRDHYQPHRDTRRRAHHRSEVH